MALDPNNKPLAGHAEANIPDRRPTSLVPHDASKASLSQVDGTADYQQHIVDANMRQNYIQPPVPRHHAQHQLQARRIHSAQALPRPPTLTSRNAVSELLPYCTTEPPLNQEQVIGLSDAVGSLKELVLLALGAAAGDAGCVERLESAVGGQAAANIAEFFIDEWEIEG